jgi:hypothetical protein
MYDDTNHCTHTTTSITLACKQAPWETPFGIVTEGFEDVVLNFYTGYGEMMPFNEQGVKQGQIFTEGNAYLR